MNPQEIIKQYMSDLGKKSSQKILSRFANEEEKRKFYADKVKKRWSDPKVQAELKKSKLETIKRRKLKRVLAREERFAETLNP